MSTKKDCKEKADRTQVAELLMMWGNVSDYLMAGSHVTNICISFGSKATVCSFIPVADTIMLLCMLCVCLKTKQFLCIRPPSVPLMLVSDTEALTSLSKSAVL